VTRPHPYAARNYDGRAPLFFHIFRRRRTLWQTILSALFP